MLILAVSELPLYTRSLVLSCSKCYHSLVELVMGSDHGDTASKEQALSIFTEVLDLLNTKAKVCCHTTSHKRDYFCIG